LQIRDDGKREGYWQLRSSETQDETVHIWQAAIGGDLSLHGADDVTLTGFQLEVGGDVALSSATQLRLLTAR
jgi:hypothetical protein